MMSCVSATLVPGVDQSTGVNPALTICLTLWVWLVN